jgi:DsbC/DsbD-like thiol-disulfide interchange protein
MLGGREGVLRMKGLDKALVIGAAVLCSAASAFCGDAGGAPIPHGTVELVAESGWIAAGRAVNLGLRFQLEKGWHVYWINPGDSGEPPKVKWDLPAGLTVGEIEWPAPKRLGSASVRDFGYEDGVMLIVPVQAGKDFGGAQTAQIVGNVSVLVCREMCLPGKAKVLLTLPVKAQTPAVDAKTEELFAATRKSLPKAAPANWKFRASEANGSFVLTASVGRQVQEATFYPLMESQIDNAAEQKIVATPAGFRLTLKKSEQLQKPIERLKGVLVLGPGQAYEIDAPVGKASAATGVETHPAKS